MAAQAGADLSRFGPPPARSSRRWASARAATANHSSPPARPTTPHTPTTTPPSAERSLLDAIAAGDLDAHLTALADAVHARQHLLHTVRGATALAALCVGDTVRINHTVSPRYLHGLHGRIIDLDDQTATVCLHRPVGRFHTSHIRCPPLALDKLPKAS